jgi:HEAT repeats
MSRAQADLFSNRGFRMEQPPPKHARRSCLVPAKLDDATLIAALPVASLADCRGLTDEAGRRRLVAAVPALEALCRRFKGFGLGHTVPEQTTALAGLAAIGGREAAAAVARIVVDRVVQGPGLTDAIRTAAGLRSRLPAHVVLPLLRHGDPDIREEACRCAHARPEVIAVLVDLLGDLNRAVARAAACALGRMGRAEAQPVLVRLLQEDPSMEVIDAAASVVDEACIVLLGRIARTRPDLASAALGALGDIHDPRAAAITAALTATR